MRRWRLRPVGEDVLCDEWQKHAFVSALEEHKAGLGMHEVVSSKADQIADVCRRHGVRRLEVFGSAARAGDFNPDRSDIDFLVEFAPQQRAWELLDDLQGELEALFGRDIDLIDRRAIETSRNPVRRRIVLGEAELLYAG